MSLLVIGSAAFDSIQTPSGSREKVIGGSGVYAAFAVAVAECGIRPLRKDLVGRFGIRSVRPKRKHCESKGCARKHDRIYPWNSRHETA